MTPWQAVIRQATARLAVALVATAAGGLTAVLAGRGDAALLVAPWVVILVLGLSATNRPDVEASMTASDERVMVGDQLEATTVISGVDGGRGRWAEVRWRPEATFWVGSWPGPEQGSAAPAGAAPLRRDGPTTVRCSLPATQWGTHDVGRVSIAIHEPYGLIRWSGWVSEPAVVRVHPDAAQLRQLLAPWFVRRLTGAHVSRAVERGVEYADLRPFGAGDSLRDINWRASARSNELWVSQRHPDRATDVVLLVDSFVESGHDVRTIFGLAIEAAVGLAESHLAVTDRVGLIELGGVVRWISLGAGRLQLQRLTDALLATRLYASAAERDLTVIPPRALPPRSFIVALSPLLDRRFIDALGVLRAGGHDVAVIDCSPLPPSFEPNDGEAARLAYRLWRIERGITRDRLAEQGIAVGRWEQDRPLDPVLTELSRWRQRGRWAARR